MTKDTMKFRCEWTDTYGGEANYSWVRRGEFTAPANATRRMLLSRARRELGLDGLRLRVTGDYGDMIEARPSRMACVLFVTPVYA
jgi:hypothetical protein